ncbi:MAG: penicillin-binding protein 2 [Chthonomonadales bacterium]|nr:penicillin-binding protein 2 [Chthonomonadales bacterium]
MTTPWGRGAASPFDRVRSLFLLGAALASALIVRVVYFQTYQRQPLATEADRRRSTTRVITPRRGDILDRNGMPLAMTRDVRWITYDPSRIWEDDKTKRPSPRRAAEVGRLLASVLGLNAADVTNSILSSSHRRGEHARCKFIKEGATRAEEEALRWFMRSKDYKDTLIGTVVTVIPERVYAAGDASVAVVGKTIPGSYGTAIGSSGIERWANTPLAGSIGWTKGRVDSGRVPIPTSTERIVSASDGANVRLTIDLTVQRICASALDVCMQEHTPKGVTAIVLDPTTGEILGMVSRPSFDPSDRTLPASVILEGQRNRALMLYEPGSVMKPVSLCIAIDAGLISETEVFPCPGYKMLNGKRINCEAHRRSTPPPGTNTPRMVIAKSCNTATADIALRIGGKRLDDGLHRFRLLVLIGIQLPGEVKGYLEGHKSGASLGPGSIARIGFGQSVMVSPLALAAAFGAIANHGVLMQPRVIKAITDPANNVVREYPVRALGQVISPQTADTMADYLTTVVSSGTGKNARLAGYVTGGKTGTALKSDGHGRYNGYMASFIGYVQGGDGRRFIIAVVVDEPHNGYHGSVAAAPTWKRIAEGLMLHWHVPPSPNAPTADVARADGDSIHD